MNRPALDLDPLRSARLGVRTRLALLACTALACAACGGPTGVQHAGDGDGPPTVTDENVYEVQQALWRMDPESARRVIWRDAVMTHLAAGSAELMEGGDYDAVVVRLASLTELLTPADIEEHRVPSQIVPLARWGAEHGAPRGDEGRVMGALLLLAAVGENADEARAERERIALWGRDARTQMTSPIEQYGSLIQVWERHDQIAPDPEVLTVLARLYTEQRDALGAFTAAGQGDSPGRVSFQQLRLAPLLIQRAPLDVAAVFLRHGDLEHAIEHVRRMGNESGVEARLVAILERARESNAQGADALVELAQGFVRARPAISAAICRLGARRFPQDGRFPLCLAGVAMERHRPGAAIGWYAEAVRLAPAEQAVYDEALARLDTLMEAGIFSVNAAQSRTIARQALAIMSERDRRWPESPSEVLSRSEILLQLGRAEMSAGNIEGARERLEASLAADPTADAHRELGLLLERIGQGQEAAGHYRQALDLTPQNGSEDVLARAALIEDLGDAFRQAGDEEQSARMYRQALGMWAELAEQVRPERRAVVDVRVGILHDRLGETRSAGEAFERALESAPSWRGPYAEILAHLVTATPNLDLAERVLRRATYQLNLPVQWRVYFALWVQTVAARAGNANNDEAVMLLAGLTEGDGWSGRLAAFGHRDLSDDQLLAAASSTGERAEALFYAGTQQLAAGNTAAARRRFQEVIETNMISFFEYAMAQELLASLTGSGQQAGVVVEQTQ